nr:MAG TPA: hypothetical protein [Caudoviricetes sp.]
MFACDLPVICLRCYYAKSLTNRIKPWVLACDLPAIVVVTLLVIHYKRRDFTWH